ncbi:hypothetical protein COHA_008806 [Chlorella ohadii]|uniref:RWD domain-containing protein 3 n=1 Tax=Chlorella ohadii TaxID=2649997 RepID=A0AAD5H2V5_9CHLO|nr:hypothetical protein COHA_008806 [Chlorella ohadii]
MELQRRFDELLALGSILGPDCTLAVLHPPELQAALLQGEFDSSSCPHITGEHTQLSLVLHPPGVPPARLHLRLQPAYPGGLDAAPLVEAVTCDALGRQWEQQALQQLQAVAAGESDECLYQLAEALLALLGQAAQAARVQLGGAQHEHVQPAAAQHAQQRQQQEQKEQQQQAQQAQQVPLQHQEPPQQLCLLKLDHMHSRSSYSRLIRRWAAELGLGGRLLFCGSSPIILILLGGAADGLKEFLLRMRTRNVDVDSKGRPCRERMMTVLALGDCRAESCTAWQACGHGGLASACGSACRSDQNSRLFAAFEEEDVSVAQLAAHLQTAGLLQHWADATGLPPPG